MFVSPKKWTLSPGSPVRGFHWKPNEPDRSETCAIYEGEITSTLTTAFDWASAECRQRNNFICQICEAPLFSRTSFRYCQDVNDSFLRFATSLTNFKFCYAASINFWVFLWHSRIWRVGVICLKFQTEWSTAHTKNISGEFSSGYQCVVVHNCDSLNHRYHKLLNTYRKVA